jgi:hypothetical protein
MLKTRVLKIFDCLKNLIIKIHVQSEVFDLQRVLKKVNHMHRDLAEIIFSLSTFKSDSASQKKKTDRNDDESLREESERRDQTLQQERHKASERQNIDSNRRENEHDDRSHEERATRIREHQ